jgi:hypothetical protein
MIDEQQVAAKLGAAIADADRLAHESAQVNEAAA